MATNFINNLSNTYRGSPSLQKQFATEQDYLDLFDNNQAAPAMATAYTPAVEKEGIESIINTKIPIINQGEGGGDGNFGGGFKTDDNLGTSDYYGPGKGLKDSITDTATGIMDFALKGGITGAVLRGIFGKKKDYEYKTAIKTAKIARDRIEEERKAAEQAIIDAQIAKDFYAGYGRTSNPGNNLGGPDGMSGGQFSGGEGFASANAYGGDGTMNDLGADNFAFAKGGRVKRSYFKGGLVSLRGK